MDAEVEFESAGHKLTFRNDNIFTETSHEPLHINSNVRLFRGRISKISTLISIQILPIHSLSSNVFINYYHNLYVSLSNLTIIRDSFSINPAGNTIIDHVHIQSIMHFHFVTCYNLSVAVLKLPTFVGRRVVISHYYRRLVNSSIVGIVLKSSCGVHSVGVSVSRTEVVSSCIFNSVGVSVSRTEVVSWCIFNSVGVSVSRTEVVSSWCFNLVVGVVFVFSIIVGSHVVEVSVVIVSVVLVGVSVVLVGIGVVLVGVVVGVVIVIMASWAGSGETVKEREEESDLPTDNSGSGREAVARWVASTVGVGGGEANRPFVRRRVFFAADSQEEVEVASAIGEEEDVWGPVGEARARRRDERRNAMEQKVQDYKDMVDRKTTEELLTEAEDERKGVVKHIDELVRQEMLEEGRTLEEEQRELDEYAEVMGEAAAKRLGFRLQEKRKKRLMEREGLLAPEEEYPGKLKEVEEATKELEDMLVLHPEEEDDLVKELEGDDSDAESTCTVVAAKEVEEWNSDASTVKNRIEVWEVVDPATIDPEVLAKKEEEAAKGLYHGKSRNARRRKNYAEKMRCAANNIGQPTSRAREGFVDLEEEAYQKELHEEERYKAMKKKIELNMKERERKNKFSKKEEEGGGYGQEICGERPGGEEHGQQRTVVGR